MDFLLFQNSKPLGWDEARGHRSSPWLVTYSRHSLRAEGDLVTIRALCWIESTNSLSSLT